VNKLSDQQIANVAKASGWQSTSDIATAVAIALAESGGVSDITSPPNKNGTVDRGLWQVNSVHGYDPSELLTPTGNGRAAHAVYLKEGWRAWSKYKNGKYRVFLARGMAVAGKASDTGGGSGADVTKDAPIPNPLSPLGDFGSLLTSAETWYRLGLFLAGGLLLVYAGFKLTGDNKLGEGTKAVASFVATKGIVK
jgi:hypothetical protein